MDKRQIIQAIFIVNYNFSRTEMLTFSLRIIVNTTHNLSCENFHACCDAKIAPTNE